MSQTLSPRPSRRATYVAFALFALAYVAIMVIIFAPEGSFSSRGPLLVTEQTE